ncbi:MAG: proline--tRNA ligase [Bdellovibrionales bacterium]|nr:proline--tRNA ligase [Bdellovibrionales bacterium]
MRWTQNHIFTLRDAPADAEIPSHKLLVRGGFIKKVAPGIFTYQNLALRSLRKVEKIIREELDKRGCTEVLMPVVNPRELWEETNRWTEMGAGLLKFKNRNDHEFCLAATHEEIVTDLVRHDLKSYRDFPKNIYQIQTKYRDEIRPRFGLMRGREFIMKDAYSFDRTYDEAQVSYQKMYEAYEAIFTRLGFDFAIVEADTGSIGGNQSHEFHVLADFGEDALMISEGFAANLEIAPAQPRAAKAKVGELPKEEFATPGLRSIDDLSKSTGISAQDLVKTMFFKDDNGKSFAVLLCGDDEVNPIKLKNSLKLSNPPELLNDEEVKQLTGASPGSCGPVGLKCPIYMDQRVSVLQNFIVGANRDDFHLKNVNAVRDFNANGTGDYVLAKSGEICPNTQKPYQLKRGIEVGHVFYLGQKYSKAMKANYLDSNGKSQIIEMGCYGIGVSRTMQAAVEQNHDEDGIKWPKSISPFHVHICALDVKSESVMGEVDRIERELTNLGYDVLVDDRDERPGIKFKDADLLGFPIRITVGQKGLDNGNVEMVDRSTKEKSTCRKEEIVTMAKEKLGRVDA